MSDPDDSISISKSTLKIGGIVAVGIVVAVVLALVTDGGSDSDEGQQAQVEAGSDSDSGDEDVPVTTPEDEPEPAADDCDALGINHTERKEGSCTDSTGQKKVVVNQASQLVLPGLSATLEGIEYADSISGFGNVQPEGQFVIFSLSVTNTTKSPQYFDAIQEQVRLVAGDREFSQDFDALNGPEKQSFLWQGKEIQPGASQTGTVVFDIPLQSVKDIAKDGNLLIASFGSDLDYFGKNETLGTIRTYD